MRGWDSRRRGVRQERYVSLFPEGSADERLSICIFWVFLKGTFQREESFLCFQILKTERCKRYYIACTHRPITHLHRFPNISYLKLWIDHFAIPHVFDEHETFNNYLKRSWFHHTLYFCMLKYLCCNKIM